MRPPLIVRGMWGLGDNIYQRPFIAALAASHDVYLDTPWPELYSDLDIRFVRAERALRCQMKNVCRQPAGLWSEPPRRAQEMRIVYGHEALRRCGSIVEAVRQYTGLAHMPASWDLPPLPTVPVPADKPIALVRPVTVRSDWRNEARNPLPCYVNRIAERLSETHHVIAVADLQLGAEWLAGEMPPHHLAFAHGELNIMELLGLAAQSDIIVGGVGWIAPAAIALRRKAFIVLGGMGGHNGPEVITHPAMDLSRIAFAVPDRFCGCISMDHHCDKAIGNIDEQFDAALARWR